MTIFAVWKYMDGHHLFCTIPAFVIFIVFVIGVPFALIAPSVAMAFEWKHCNRLIHNRFYISFVKPFLERFLSVFNNNLKCHLFFSFYFLFRLILLLMITFLKRDQFQITLMASFCFLMFLIFTIVRPYQNDIYNYFDIFILFNLTVIGFLSHGKLKLFLWDGKTIYIDWVIRVLLWVPLMTWMVVLIMLYRGAIRNNCLAIWVRFSDRHADIDEWDESWSVSWSGWKGLIRRNRLPYLLRIRKKSSFLKSYVWKLLDTTQSQGKCFCLYLREYVALYSFCCWLKLLHILFRNVQKIVSESWAKTVFAQ